VNENCMQALEGVEVWNRDEHRCLFSRCVSLPGPPVDDRDRNSLKFLRRIPRITLSWTFRCLVHVLPPCDVGMSLGMSRNQHIFVSTQAELPRPAKAPGYGAG
jgi:hypothetical protein